jgi:hypothetical protein
MQCRRILTALEIPFWQTLNRCHCVMFFNLGDRVAGRIREQLSIPVMAMD